MTRLADSIRLPERARRGRIAANGAPTGPTLVRGRGLARRRPRSGGALRILSLLLLALGLVLVALRWL